ncbi:hypothetical protein HMPREF3187_01175 [Aerococcus christensenii]|uniref:Uncharacterized protein n=2 Tax=Aerococcus christensenii TaxID=87541 RepID=A0A133XXW6_9LACT|nr:hypothetical protein HMPREF3187_01175 [Aerococcus christensenii]
MVFDWREIMGEKKELKIKLNLNNKYELKEVIDGWMKVIKKMEAEHNYDCTLLEVNATYD